MRCMEVDNCKFFSKWFNYIYVSPFFFANTAKMKLDDNLIDIVKILKGKIFKCIPLAALAVYLQGNMFACQVVRFQCILKHVHSIFIIFVSSITKTDHLKVVEIIIYSTNRCFIVGTVILIIRYIKLGW